MFYKTRFVLIVLSESPCVDGMELSEVITEADTGSFVMNITEALTEEVDVDEMRTLLIDAGSEPGFFGIDEDEDDVYLTDEVDGGK